MKNIAHLRADGTIQTLEEHLLGTADLCSDFAGAIGMAETGRAIGLLHDLGKATAAFNDYIQSDDSEYLRGSIDIPQPVPNFYKNIGRTTATATSYLRLHWR